MSAAGRLSCVLVLVFLPASMGFAQEGVKTDGKSVIAGTVTDQTSAVVTGAKVVLTNTAGFHKESQTGPDGTYSFSNLDPGTYTLTVTAPNFADKILDNIPLTAGQTLSLEASLEPAGEKTEVNVESSGVGKVEAETAMV